jgi:AbiU2
MATNLEGDYSKYPEVIREAFSRIAGETCELRQTWLIYHRLFMDNEHLTQVMSEQLGPLLGVLQAALEDLLFLSVSRLTDKDNPHQPNLSVWTLKAAVPFSITPTFAATIDAALTEIWKLAADLRLHRHKRVAHFDRDVGLKIAPLPEVKLIVFRAVLESIERYLNLFFWEFEQTTMMFDMLSAHEITGKAEVTVLKARACDVLRKRGIIDESEWRRLWKELSEGIG